MRVTKGLFARSVLAALPLYAGQANAAKVNPLEILGKQQLGFEQNRGQAREDVDYVATTGTGNVYVRSTGAILLLSRRDPLVGIGLGIDFAGARALAKGQPENLVPGVNSSYFSGTDRSKWITGLPKYAKLRYQGVWPGIDVVYYGNGSRLEYDFVIAPGANPAAIQLRFSGMDSIQLAPNGDLELRTAAGLLYQRAPEIYQLIAGMRRKVNGRYVLSGNEAAFQVAKYDRTKPLVIDPVLVYSKSDSFMSAATFQGNGVAVDASGNAYVTGIASPSQPTVNGPIVFRTFLISLDNAGNYLRSQTFGGTDGNTFGNALAIDSSLNVYIAGSTGATDTGLGGWGFQPAYGGGTDAWFSKLARQSDGSYLPSYITYIGGSGFDSANAVAFDSAGKAYVVGTTFSSNFRTTTGASFRAAGSTAFLVKIDPSIQAGSGSLVYSTLIGGTGTDNGTGVAVDGSFNAYVGGTTTSTTLSGGFQPASSTGFAASKQNTNLDGFIVKLNALGTAATNLTFFSNGPINGMALGSDNSVYIVGNTNGGIPVNSALAGYQVGSQGGQDAFLAKFDPTLSTLAYSSYIGGTADDSANSVAVDQNGNAVVVGQTSSPNFPSTTTALQATGSDVLPDAFISRINTATSGAASLSFSGTLGGDGIDRARSVVIDAPGNAYITGDTASTNLPPATGQANSQRAFVAKINTIVPPPQAVSVTPNTGSGSSQTFQFLASDAVGSADLTQVWMWFTASFSNSSASSCMLFYNQTTNQINLLNDAGSAWMSMTRGAAGTLQNSQCSLNAGAMTVTPSGNNLTVSMPMTFQAAYAGAKQVWLYAAGGAGNSGWQQRGTWTATAPSAPVVTAVSVTPSTGSGLTQTFQFLASDSNGSTDLTQVWMWFTAVFSNSSASSCMLFYSQTTNQINLLNDAGSAWMSMTPGTAGSLQNSQCSLNVGAMTLTPSGTNLTVSMPMTFKAAYAGAKQVWMYAGGGAGNSGWQQRGTWTVQ